MVFGYILLFKGISEKKISKKNSIFYSLGPPYEYEMKMKKI